MERLESVGDAGQYDGEATLAALEAILRANAPQPGRKVVVLFTTPAFGSRRPDLMSNRLKAVKQLSREAGFVIWTVDTSGVRGPAPVTHSYFGMLAKETGGETVRGATDMLGAFANAAEALSCYYTVGFKVDAAAGERPRMLTVALDTKRRPELWRLEVLAPSSVTLPDARTRLIRERIAALQVPDDFATPPVRVALGFPVREGDRDMLPVRVRVPLDALTWVPDQPEGFLARALLDIVVQRDNGTGSERVCALDPESGGAVTLKLRRIPSADSRAALAVEVRCPADRGGLHTARAVVTDLEGGRVGAGRSTIEFEREGTESWQASALRVEASSGFDILWSPGRALATQDKERRASRRIEGADAANAGDRLYFDYVLCGPDVRRVPVDVRHDVLIEDDGNDIRVALTFPPDALEFAGAPAPGRRGFCAQSRLTLAPYELAPGDYRFRVLAADGSVAGSETFSVW